MLRVFTVYFVSKCLLMLTETLLEAPETLLGVQNQAYNVVHEAKQTHLLSSNFVLIWYIRLLLTTEKP